MAPMASTQIFSRDERKLLALRKQRPAVIRSTIFVGLLLVCSLIRTRASPADSTNTGMADPSALEAAFERFDSRQSNLLAFSLANLRGFPFIEKGMKGFAPAKKENKLSS